MKKTVLKITAFLLTATLSLAALFGCGMKEDVSVLYYTFADTYISGVRQTMDMTLRGAGIGYHNYDAGGNQTTQTEQVDTAISKGAMVLAVNVVDTGSDDAASAIIEKARGANIPVIFFNRSVAENVVKSYDKCVFVGTDYEMAGRLQGEIIGNYLLENYDDADLNGDGKISYVLFKGQQGNLEAEARTRYAVEVCNEILAAAGKPAIVFYDTRNPSGYIVDQNGIWSSAAANDSMKTILSGHSEAAGNMVELVIANNDEMALGALAALEEAGYNRSGAHHIPVFGVDASEAARAKIREGKMTGTVKQDGAKMAEVIAKIAENFINGRPAFDGVAEDMLIGDWRVNIPYSAYTGEGGEEG